MLTLSQRDRDRLMVVRQVEQREISVNEGARRAGVGLRHMRRLLRRFEREGDAVVVHGLRGRPSNRRLPDELRSKALEKAGKPVYHDFGPTLLSEHMQRDPEIGPVHASTLRLWMIQSGAWTPEERKARHRRRRERRKSFGELVLMDTSIHAWLEDRSSEEIVLIALIDDATSRLSCRFFSRDTGAANRQLLLDYIACHGRMEAVYADQASHFRNHFNRKARIEAGKDEALTLIQRALSALDIELIRALSPQAKGRVERLFGTLQDRLIKEMRVAGICSMADANRFLEEVFLPFWDERFTVDPSEPVDAHRPLSEGTDLQRIFAETEERVVRKDFTFRYKNAYYQIEEAQAAEAMSQSKITIERRLDGSVHFRWRDCYLDPTALPAAPAPKTAPAAERPSTQRPLAGAAGKPVPPDHPWRRYPVLVGKGKARFSSRAVASASLRPDSPAMGNVLSPSP